MYTLFYTSSFLTSNTKDLVGETRRTFFGTLGGATAVLLGYPLWRGWAQHMGQIEHLRTSFTPSRIWGSQLTSQGVLHAVWKNFRIDSSIRSLYYGIAPLLCMTPFVSAAFSTTSYLRAKARHERSPMMKWTYFGGTIAALVALELAVAPLRTMHLAMATTPSGVGPLPSMTQLASKMRNIGPGLFPFMLAGLIVGTADLLVDNLNLFKLEEGDQFVVKPLEFIAFLSTGFIAHIAYLTGIRTLVDSLRTVEKSTVPKYTSMLEPLKMQLKSGPRMFLAGMCGTMLVGTGLGIFVQMGHGLDVMLRTGELERYIKESQEEFEEVKKQRKM
jgi:hypothetical protein